MKKMIGTLKNSAVLQIIDKLISRSSIRCSFGDGDFYLLAAYWGMSPPNWTLVAGVSPDAIDWTRLVAESFKFVEIGQIETFATVSGLIDRRNPLIVSMHERALIHRAQQGDTDAFEELVNQHSQFVYNLALRLLRDPQEAEDLAQEAFIRVWKALPTFRADARFTTWLYRIVANLCYNPIAALES